MSVAESLDVGSCWKFVPNYCRTDVIIHVIRCSQVVFTTSGLSRHIGHLVDARLDLFSSSCSPIIFRKVTSAFSLIPCGYEMAAKTVARTFTHPLSATQRLIIIHCREGWNADRKSNRFKIMLKWWLILCICQRGAHTYASNVSWLYNQSLWTLPRNCSVI